MPQVHSHRVGPGKAKLRLEEFFEEVVGTAVSRHSGDGDVRFPVGAAFRWTTIMLKLNFNRVVIDGYHTIELGGDLGGWLNESRVVSGE